jgi:site-specific recombinase XerD
MIPFNMSKTENTKHRYLVITMRLIKRFQRETSIQANNNLLEFYSWFISKIPTWQYSTLRQYKAAVIDVARKYQCHKLEAMFDKISHENCKPKTSKLPANERKTTAQKAKSINKSDYKKIVASFGEHGSDIYWQERGFIMFNVIYWFGLRPCEFRKIKLVKMFDNGSLNLYLRVKNAKDTNYRAHGKYRHLGLQGCPDIVWKFLALQLKYSKNTLNANGESIAIEDYITYCSQGFSQYIKKLFPTRAKRICLYSARHQFCANLKKAGYSKTDAAALMGHAVDSTHMKHYGKRRSGYKSFFTPTALSSEVAKIRQILHVNPFSENAPVSVKNISNSEKNTLKK